MIRSAARAVARGLALLGLAILLTGCLTTKSYVDTALPVVSKADVVAPAEPRPVQLVVEFRTQGSPNAAATAEVRGHVVSVAEGAGLFSRVDASGGDGDLLTIVIDNVVLTDNAAAKGFGTGLTFGAVGSMVTDGYVCTATYLRDGVRTEVTAKHALHTTIGNHGGPEGMTPVPMAQGVQTVMEQLTWNVLKQLADQRAFD